jgi:hypothetical protein
MAAKKRKARAPKLSKRRLLVARKALVRMGARKFKGTIAQIDRELERYLLAELHHRPRKK